MIRNPNLNRVKLTKELTKCISTQVFQSGQSVCLNAISKPNRWLVLVIFRQKLPRTLLRRTKMKKSIEQTRVVEVKRTFGYE